MDISKKREVLQEYYYNREYTKKEKVIGILYWLIKAIIFISSTFFIGQNFNKDIASVIILILSILYYALFKEYSAIKYKYYDKVFEYSEIINQVEKHKIKKLINESNSIYEIKDKMNILEMDEKLEN